MENIPIDNIPIENIQNVQAYDFNSPLEPGDPDNPRWNVFGGIGVWFGSVVVLFLIPSIALAIMFFVQKPQGILNASDSEAMKEAMTKWAMSPPSLLVQIASTLIAHLLTIALCWAVATKFGKFSFKEAIGWEWNANHVQKFILVVGIIGVTIGIMQVLPKFIPDSQNTPFNEMLKSSQSVRYAIALLAVITAPITEELVYRGLIYSPLRRAIGIVGAVVISTLLFAIVHVPQYWGAWASLTGLLFLSLALTITRALTKSLFPCVAIHTLFNLIGALGIVLSGGKTE